MLTGGGRSRDLDRLLTEETGLPVLVAEEPLTCVVRGCGMALDSLDARAASSPAIDLLVAPCCWPECAVVACLIGFAHAARHFRAHRSLVVQARPRRPRRAGRCTAPWRCF